MKEHDKRLLEAIQQAARARDVLSDPRWDALAKGTLSETDEAALCEEAKRSPAMAEAYELFRPFDAKTKAAMIARVAPASPALPKARSWRRASAVLALAAALAALVVWLIIPPPDHPQKDLAVGPRLGPVPGYAIAVVGGEQAQLGAPDDAGAPPLLQDPESRLDVTLRPDRNVEGVIDVRAWLVRDHHATRWEPPIEKRPNGVVLIAGTKRALFRGIPAGSWELVFAVGRREALPGDAEILTEPERSADRPAREQPYWILRTRVDLRDAKEGSSGSPAGPSPSTPFEVEFDGCAGVRALDAEGKGKGGIACEIPANHMLTLWVKAPPEATIEMVPETRPGAWRPALIAVTTDAAASPETGTPMQGGRRIAVTVPDGADTLTVTTEQGGARASYSLALVPRESIAALEKAEELRGAKPDEAKALLLPLLSDNRLWVRGRAKGMLARIERKIDRKRELFDEAMALHHKAGRISEEMEDGATLANRLMGVQKFAEARRVLDRIEPLQMQFPKGRSLVLHYRARLASSVGNLREALRLFGAAWAIADRLDAKGHLADVIQFEAPVLLMLGRWKDAMKLDERGDELSRHAKPCQRAQFLSNWGDQANLAAESFAAVAADIPDPLPKLREALSIYQGSCNQPGAKAAVLTNLAIASLAQRRVDEARDYLEQARTVQPSPDDESQAWRMILEAKLALASQKPEKALRSYETSAQIAARASLPDLRVRSMLGRSQALDELGRAGEARQAYRDADEVLDSWSLSAPLGEGRETFLARYKASTQERVDFLLRRAERERPPAAWIEEAATAARKGRARILSSLQWLDRLDALSPSEHTRWENAVAEYRRRVEELHKKKANDEHGLSGVALKRAADEAVAENKRLHDAFEEALSRAPRTRDNARLPVPPAPGEVMLLCQPVQEGWVGFAITRDRVAFHRLAETGGGAQPEQIAARLLDAFSDVLEGAERIRFVPDGRLSEVDFHKLSFRGQLLVERFTVTYGVDLPRARGVLPAREASPLAVVVADPKSDAPLTSRAASHVARALQDSGWRVELIERAEATHEAVRAALEKSGVELFFYAGHGLYHGLDGWEGGLVLSHDVRFTVADVMALSRVPPKVVLSGCQTAQTGANTPVEGLGLAQAFVVAGANEVVATARNVEAKLAEQVMQALYDKGEGGAALPGHDLPAALRAAQRAVSKDPEPGDWAAFRVLVP